jgi:hypothetical protein
MPPRLRVSVVVPTFEPDYAANPALEDYYAANFDSWLDPDGGFAAAVVLSDFASSAAFKAFLHRYAAARGAAVYLIDGGTRALSSTAANVGFRLLPYDIAVWAASDTRARDRRWLGLLTGDFADPTTMAVYAASPAGASHLVDQLQAAPLDRPPRRVAFPDCPIPNVVAYRKELLAPFDDRLSDISGFDISSGSAWQLAALGGHAVVSYRCNVVHDPFHGGGRYSRSAARAWTETLRPTERDMFRRINAFLSIPDGVLDPAGFRPVVRPAVDGLRAGGLRGLARALYIRARQSQLMYSRNAIRNKGFWPYVLQRRIARRQHAAFLALPPHARRGLVRALYFSDPATYDTLSYEVWRGAARIERRPPTEVALHP